MRLHRKWLVAACIKQGGTAELVPGDPTDKWVDLTKEELAAIRAQCPKAGLGDAVAGVLSAVGFKKCDNCEDRHNLANSIL